MYKIKHGSYPTSPSTISGEGLLKKLNILYAEKLAGSNNVANEATEILNELKKNKIIDSEKVKETSKLFK